jgi:hypothetical protein
VHRRLHDADHEGEGQLRIGHGGELTGLDAIADDVHDGPADLGAEEDESLGERLTRRVPFHGQDGQHGVGGPGVVQKQNSHDRAEPDAG